METTEQLSIRQNMLWNSIGSLTNLGCQWVITVLVVRLASNYEIAGVYSLAMSIFNMFSQLAQYRMYTVQISDVQHENTVGEYFTFRLITVAASLFLLGLYAFITCRMEAMPAILIYAVYKSAGLLIDVMHASNQVSHRMDYIGKSLVFQGVSALGSFILVFGVFKSLEGALTLMVFSTILIGALYDFPRSNRLASIHLGISLKKTMSLFQSCLPIVVGGIAASAAPSIPRQYLSASMGDSALGIYASVAAPVAIIQMGATYIYNPLLSYLVEHYLDKDKPSFCKLFLKIILSIVAVGIVCSVALLFAGQSLLSLIYGDGIAEYIDLLQPMLFCAFVTGATWFINDLLVSLKNYRGVFIGSMGSLMVAILAMVPCQFLFGLNGATVTNIVSNGICLIYQSISLWQQAKKWFRPLSEEVDNE